MTDILLSAKNLSVRFGGVLAVNQVSFDVKKGEVFTLIGPNGAGKTTVFNLISRIYTPTTGEIDYEGPQGRVKLTDQGPQDVAALGIARTFQNIELFEPMGLYGRWLKSRTYLQMFPVYRQGLFKRQKSCQKSDRLTCRT